MVENSPAYGGWIWRCDWGHIGFDFESESEAVHDFKKHVCNMSI